MPTGSYDGVVRQLRRAVLQVKDAERGDGELLERFITHRDDRAFESLVRRHGPMVLGVCQRVLRNQADAEDAFQATFVVFIRKAASIVPAAKVANWLYGVAHKTALKAGAMNRTRRVKERQAAMAPRRNAPDDVAAQVLDILDRELHTLPEKYRTPIILCDLEGRSYKEAAAQLGCPAGTLSGRLTRARALLARRLASHGLLLPAGVLVTILAQRASASLSPSLIAWTVRTAALLATGKGVCTGVVSARVAVLAQGVLKMLLLSKLRIPTAVLLLVLAAIATGWIFSAQVSAHVTTEGEHIAVRADDDPPAQLMKGAPSGPTNAREAEFVFRAENRAKQTVSLVVAGTSAPILNLPVKDDLRVLVGGRVTGLGSLRLGARVAIRMDPTHGAIEEIRALEESRHATILAGGKDVEQFAAPSMDEVLSALLPKGPRGVPLIHEVFHDDIRLVAERLLDRTDPPRFFPQVGPAQLHHCHWKCTVHYTETVESSYPFPFTAKRPRVEVVYIDKDYLVLSK